MCEPRRTVAGDDGDASKAGPPRTTRLICPTGWLRDFVSSPISKNISLRGSVETALSIRHPVPHEGRFAVVTDAGRDAVDADRAVDEQRGSGR
jgi:hypothetical protein